MTSAGPVGLYEAHYAGSRGMRTAIGPEEPLGSAGGDGGLGTVEADAPPAALTPAAAADSARSRRTHRRPH